MVPLRGHCAMHIPFLSTKRVFSLFLDFYFQFSSVFILFFPPFLSFTLYFFSLLFFLHRFGKDFLSRFGFLSSFSSVFIIFFPFFSLFYSLFPLFFSFTCTNLEGNLVPLACHNCGLEDRNEEGCVFWKMSRDCQLF